MNREAEGTTKKILGKLIPGQKRISWEENFKSWISITTSGFVGAIVMIVTKSNM